MNFVGTHHESKSLRKKTTANSLPLHNEVVCVCVSTIIDRLLIINWVSKTCIYFSVWCRKMFLLWPCWIASAMPIICLLTEKLSPETNSELCFNSKWRPACATEAEFSSWFFSNTQKIFWFRKVRFVQFESTFARSVFSFYTFRLCSKISHTHNAVKIEFRIKLAVELTFRRSNRLSFVGLSRLFSKVTRSNTIDWPNSTWKSWFIQVLCNNFLSFFGF